MRRKILVTGGAGFIGSAVIRYILKNTDSTIINLDKLTYAGNLFSLNQYKGNKNYFFEKVDICDKKKLIKIFQKYKPQLIMHLAAETHVDRSIDGAGDFVQTNIIGTFNLLEVSRKFYSNLSEKNKEKFRFHHVSTDEVYGDLGLKNKAANEKHSYNPSSPYSASKASADHLVRSWHRTYNLPIIISNCSNNYGPFHFPEKLIPLIILNALELKKLPVYGNGKQIRDWLYVEDHASALYKIVTKGKVGETYNIGGNNQLKNIDVVKKICRELDKIKPLMNEKISRYEQLIEYVEDRPGHDLRYSINTSKIKKNLNWKPSESFKTGIVKTIKWYIKNTDWTKKIQSNNYQRERLGIKK